MQINSHGQEDTKYPENRFHRFGDRYDTYGNGHYSQLDNTPFLGNGDCLLHVCIKQSLTSQNQSAGYVLILVKDTIQIHTIC